MRTLLFVPADDERKIAKALAGAADALILDLEDAVAPARKAAARFICRNALQTAAVQNPAMGVPTAGMPTIQKYLFVRINALDTAEAAEDLAAVVSARPYGIVLPKCRSNADVLELGRQLDALEQAAGISGGALRILPIVTETAASLFGLGSYSQPVSPRLCGMMWGGEDLAADLGAGANRDAAGVYTTPYQLARALCLAGASAAGVPAVDSVYTDFRDAQGLQAEAMQGLRDGFSAKAAIHPEQIEPIHAAFKPTDEDIARAIEIVQAFAAAGNAGATAINGRMLDRPHYRSAMRLLARAHAAGATLPDSINSLLEHA